MHNIHTTAQIKMCRIRLNAEYQDNTPKLIVSLNITMTSWKVKFDKLYLQQHVKPSTYPGRNITSMCNISTLKTTNIGELN